MGDNTMIKNPLFNNKYYNFSNMYDDSLLTNFAPIISSETYGESIQYQEDAEPRIRHYFTPNSLFYKAKYGDLKPIYDELASNIYLGLLKRNDDIGDSTAANNFISNGLKYPSTKQVREEYDIPATAEVNPYFYKKFIIENFLMLELPNFPMPVYNKKLYLSTYGISNQIVPILDTYTKPDIFQNPLLVHIGDYYRFDPIIIGISDTRIMMLIPKNNAIKNELYTAEDEICILSEPKSLAYAIGSNGNNNRVQLTSNSSTNITTINIKVNPNKINIGKDILYKINDINESNVNTYDLYMTTNGINYGHQTMAVITPTKVTMQDRSPYISIEIPTPLFTVINNGYKASNDVGGKDRRIYYLIKRPRRVREIDYTQSSNSASPIFSFDYTYNPVSNINLEVYNTEKKTVSSKTAWIKRKRICDEQIGINYIDEDNVEHHQRYFPNIIDLSKYKPSTVGKSGLKIEIYEHPSSYTNQKMRNYISPLMSSLTKNPYTEYVINEYDKIIRMDNTTNYMHLKDYCPTYYNLDINEYIESDYRDENNFRGYMLEKLIQSIMTDPYLLKDYYQWIANKDRRIISTYGTPATYKFSTTGSSIYGSLEHKATTTNKDYTYKQPISWGNKKYHSYIKYYSEGNEIPYMLFLRGKYTASGYHDFYKSFNYIWYNCDELNVALTGKTAAQKCYDGMIDTITDSKPIVLDFFPGSYISFADVPTDSITNFDSDVSYKLFEEFNDRPIRICDIRMYDKTTGTFIKEIYDYFDIILSVDKYDLDHITLDPDRAPISSDLRSIIYFFTHMDANEYYLTQNEPIDGTEYGPAISLQYPKEDLSLNELFIELKQAGIISNDNKEKQFFTHKKLRPEDLSFNPLPTSTSLQGNSYTFFLANYKSELPISASDFTHIDDNIYEQTIPNALKDYDLNRYIVFVDGLLNTQFSFEYSALRFGADLKIIYHANDSSANESPNIKFANKSIIIVHMPIDFYIDNVESIAQPNGGYVVRYMKPAIIDTTSSGKLVNTSIEKLWPYCNSTDIYNDGIVNKDTNYTPTKLYPFEDPNNMRFSEDGHRLPPFDSSVYSINLGYYKKDTISLISEYYALHGTMASGNAIIPKIDYPITTISEVSPLNQDREFTGDETSNPPGTNPLDICFLT